MAEESAAIREGVREILLGGVLIGQDPSALQISTPLITGGVLDSIRTVKLVGELEKRFDVSFEAFEMSVDYLDTIDVIAATVEKKLGAA
jgi:acyl carrier protein